ncbi:monocarboxylate transporter 12-B isoform X3 [Scophthalmus maximus]|uniref:monocarboxylate transporter 12-B isoform X3 n=1 Tax=Scophthalmus maximus TaxID=52904 RepID=UPI0015E0A196|nr:monocarboxylate transporter 12-B isoform X3 [Scophthalmus maximus]
MDDMIAPWCLAAVCISIFFVEFQAHFGADYSATAWIHSLVDCTTMLCGQYCSCTPGPVLLTPVLLHKYFTQTRAAPVGSLVGNRWSCRAAVMLGGLLSSCGLLLSSFTNSLELLYFTIGVVTGLGFALCYTPTIAMVGCYFGRRKALAYGIAMSGSGIGTFVLAPAVQLLIELYSWRGALLVLSAFVGNLCVCGALLGPITVRQEEGVEVESAGEERRGNVSSHNDELVEKLSKESEDGLSLLPENPTPQVKKRRCFSSCFLSSKEYRFLLLPDFLFLAMSFLFLASGCSLPFVYLVPYALSAGVSHQHAAFLMSILGVIDIVGNITFGWLTDRRCLKPYRLACYIVSVAMEGFCCLFVPLLRSFPLLVPFAVLYGYFDGAYVALIPVVTSDIVGAPYLSSALGVVYFLHAIPYLVSPPIGGWLVDITGSYTATFYLSGAALLASSLILSTVAGIRRCRRRHHLTEHEPLPLSMSDQSDCVIAFNNAVVSQAS